MQRIGRVWHGPNGSGEGWLIYEKWVPTCNQAKPAANKKRKNTSDGGDTRPSETTQNKTGAKPERKCDTLVQKLVTETECRRKFLNQVYSNPTQGE